MRMIPILLVTALAGSALAQKADSFDLSVANIVILQNKAVQKELKVTEAQRAKMNAHAKGYDTDARGYMAELQKQGKDPSKMTGPDAKMLGFISNLRSKVLAELTAAQAKRLREITLQTSGLAGMLDPNVAKRLGIAAATTKKMQAAFADGQKTAAQLQNAAIAPVVKPYEGRQPKSQAEADALQAEVQPKVAAARKKVEPQVKQIEALTQKKLLSMISKKQKDDYLALQGKPFSGK